jgi:hypothetical protein
MDWLRSLREAKDLRMSLLAWELARALRELGHPGAGRLLFMLASA